MRRAETQKAQIASRGAADSGLANIASGSSGRSPGNTTTSVCPSNVFAPAFSPAAATPAIDGKLSPLRDTIASRVARTAESATTSMAAPENSARSTARLDHAPQDRFQAVVTGMMQMVGLGRGEQHLVGARRKHRAEPGSLPDLETAENVGQRAFEVGAPHAARH